MLQRKATSLDAVNKSLQSVLSFLVKQYLMYLFNVLGKNPSDNIAVLLRDRYRDSNFKQYCMHLFHIYYSTKIFKNALVE